MSLWIVQYTLKPISNWPPSFYHILGKGFWRKVQITKYNSLLICETKLHWNLIMGTHLTERINMDTLKTKLQYQYKSYLMLFQCIVCPPAVAITEMYIVPHDIMHLWRNCCRMAHLMSNTRWASWDLVAASVHTHCTSICPTRAC